jgi:hypothetical protein
MESEVDCIMLYVFSGVQAVAHLSGHEFRAGGKVSINRLPRS